MLYLKTQTCYRLRKYLQPKDQAQIMDKISWEKLLLESEDLNIRTGDISYYLKEKANNVVQYVDILK